MPLTLTFECERARARGSASSWLVHVALGTSSACLAGTQERKARHTPHPHAWCTLSGSRALCRARFRRGPCCSAMGGPQRGQGWEDSRECRPRHAAVLSGRTAKAWSWDSFPSSSPPAACGQPGGLRTPPTRGSHHLRHRSQGPVPPGQAVQAYGATRKAGIGVSLACTTSRSVLGLGSMLLMYSTLILDI